jgi:hypothetical protein
VKPPSNYLPFSFKERGQGVRPLRLRKAILKSFNSGNYTAVVQLASSYKVYLEDIAVARNLPAAEMTAGRKVAVVFFDENNPKEAVVIAVYT